MDGFWQRNCLFNIVISQYFGRFDCVDCMKVVTFGVPEHKKMKTISVGLFFDRKSFQEPLEILMSHISTWGLDAFVAIVNLTLVNCILGPPKEVNDECELVCFGGF